MSDLELTTDEAAEILGVTAAHVRWYHRNGHLPGRRAGKLVLLFKLADVEALKQNKPKRTGRPSTSAGATPPAPKQAKSKPPSKSSKDKRPKKS